MSSENVLNLISMGDKFYRESGTWLGVLYTENGERSDWGKVSAALNSGKEVTIRPATEYELFQMEKKLSLLKRAGR